MVPIPDFSDSLHHIVGVGLKDDSLDPFKLRLNHLNDLETSSLDALEEAWQGLCIVLPSVVLGLVPVVSYRADESSLNRTREFYDYGVH